MSLGAQPLWRLGFRPFYLMAAIFAALSVALWAAQFAGLMPAAYLSGPTWHAHEMLFGYTSAALAGFMLTAIPNWTGRLPVSGTPLLGLVGLWLLGRLVMAFPEWLGLPASMLLDACFLPMVAAVAASRPWVSPD